MRVRRRGVVVDRHIAMVAALKISFVIRQLISWYTHHLRPAILTRRRPLRRIMPLLLTLRWRILAILWLLMLLKARLLWRIT